MDHEDRSPFLLKNMSKHLQFIEKFVSLQRQLKLICADEKEGLFLVNVSLGRSVQYGTVLFQDTIM